MSFNADGNGIRKWPKPFSDQNRNYLMRTDLDRFCSSKSVRAILVRIRNDLGAQVRTRWLNDFAHCAAKIFKCLHLDTATLAGLLCIYSTRQLLARAAAAPTHTAEYGTASRVEEKRNTAVAAVVTAVATFTSNTKKRRLRTPTAWSAILRSLEEEDMNWAGADGLRDACDASSGGLGLQLVY